MRQWGFTLIELLVTVAVVGVLTTGALLTVNQILVNTGRSNSQVVVLDDVHRAALQIKKDIQAYTSSNLTSETLTDLQSGTVTFSWTDQTGFEPDEDDRDHDSTYTLSSPILTRTFDNTASSLGRNIESLSCTENGNGVDVVITATSSTFPPRSETLTFSVYRRSEGAQ